MQRWARRLAAIGPVRTFDYPYMQAGRRAPDRLPRLIEAHRAVVAEARREGREIVLVGKSMGARVSCHVAALEPVRAVLCLGYPLRGQRPGSALRDVVLREARTPLMFVQGTRDPLCPLELLQPLLTELRAKAALHIVPGGDHSLEVTKTELARSQLTQDEVERRILASMVAFLATVAA